MGTVYFYFVRVNYFPSNSYILVTIYTLFLLLVSCKLIAKKNFEKYFIIFLFFQFVIYSTSKFFGNVLITLVILIIVTTILFYKKFFQIYSTDFEPTMVKVISFLLGLLGSLYVIYTQIFRKLVTPLHEFQILKGTFHHDSLYRSAIANLFYSTGIPSVGVNNLDIVKTHYFSEVYLSIFSNTINPGGSVLFNLYFFQIIFIPTLIFLLISNNRKAGNLIFFYSILACLTLISNYWGTKSFNNLPFEVSVIFFLLGFQYLKKINNKNYISIGNLLLLSVLLNLTFLSKVQTGLVLTLIILLNLNFKKVKFVNIASVAVLTSFPTINLLLVTYKWTSALDMLQSQFKTRTTFVLFLLILLNLDYKNIKKSITLITIFVSSIIFSYYTNSGNQSFFLEFLVFIFVVIEVSKFSKIKNSIYLMAVLIFYLLFQPGNALSIYYNLKSFIPDYSNEVNYKTDYENLLSSYESLNSFEVITHDADSFVWKNGYSCQYSFLITQALISKQIRTYPPENFINCQNYGITSVTPLD